ncbi:hypothetical protein [Candidatus Palauibacter sp.]|uniref:hypothetical protein n=1 Tax=Candidatus Palauibacter sp. TaxID=3101350 RepID=UPI003B51E48A
MSAILWSGDRLIQHLGGHEEELGCIGFDEALKTYVLWLKDDSGVAGNAGVYVRADEYPTLAEAKAKAAGAPAAVMSHLNWTHGVSARKDGLRALLNRLVATVKGLANRDAQGIVTHGIDECVRRLAELVKTLLRLAIQGLSQLAL